jgi:uncharacterized protein HemX
VINLIPRFLFDLSLATWLWGALLLAVVAGAAVGGWLFWRLRTRPADDDREPASWEDVVAALHDRLDQCEILLKQFAERADKQQNDLRESVKQLQTSVEALEKPFSAVASRLSKISQGGNGHRS